MRKKILLLVALISMLCIVLAIGISAAEIPEWTQITELEGMSDKSVFGQDGTKGATSRVLMSDGKTYPAYYICKNSTSLGFSFTELSDVAQKTYEEVDVVRLEVPSGTISAPQAVLKTANGYTSLVTVSLPEGFTTLNGYTFYGSSTAPSALVTVYFPSTLRTFGINEFIDCTSLEELIIPEGVEKITKDFARNATSLKRVVFPSTLKTIDATAFRYAGLTGEIVLPEGLTTIGQYAFANTNVESVVLPSTLQTIGTYVFTECSSLVSVTSKSPTIGNQMFYKCPNIENVVLENTVTIGTQAFNNPNGGTTNIKDLVLPEGLTSIGNYAFARCKITEIVLPSTLTTVSESVFLSCLSLKKVVALNTTFGVNMFQSCSALNELVLTDKFTTFGKNSLGSVSSTTFTIYYTGTDYERIRDLGSACTDRFKENSGKGTSYCTYEDYLNGNYRQYKYMCIYDINLCTAAFDDIHTEPSDDGNCTTALVCSMCKEYTIREAKEHISNSRAFYASYTEKGEYYVGCTNEGCTVGTTEELSPLFTCLGYSSSYYGNSGLALGFVADRKAIARYNELTGEAIGYGIFAVAQSNAEGKEIIDVNGVGAKGVASVEFSGREYDVLEMKITGFETEEHKNAQLALGAYVIDGGKVHYLQIGTPAEGQTYSYTSYNAQVQ